jgi:non-canonical purine NTP pyrophosphatase (RdgB/HAM1 family)
VKTNRVKKSPVKRRVAAVSVGVIGGEVRADLEYVEDVKAEVDMNVVMSSEGQFVEVQGTGENGTFDRGALNGLLDAAVASITELDLHQRRALGIRELRPMLGAAGFEPRPPDEADIKYDRAEEEIEVFETFEANARAKARYYYERGGGVLVLADDSGLAVDALGGAPGVRSKRWSGSHEEGHALDDANNAHLQRELAAQNDRRAKYVCVAVIGDARGFTVARGETTGTIAESPSGSGGFGYDPYFVSDDLGVAFGAASREEKERVSHRGRAVRAVLETYLAKDSRDR